LKKTKKTDTNKHLQSSVAIEALFVDAIVKVKAEAEERVKALTEEIVKLKAETAEKQKAITIIESKRSVAGGVSKTIQRIAPSLPDLPCERSLAALAIYAKDIMQKKLVWGNPEDSVQETITKMQQHNTGYLLIGRDGVLEGLVSKSDLAGAISPYLRPEFAKWRLPLDDATLKIKVKWIMSRPVHTIIHNMPLADIMENMSRLHLHALPVTDQQGKILGLITEADIFKAILKSNNELNIDASDKSNQVQSESPTTPECTRIQPAKTSRSSLVPAV